MKRDEGKGNNRRKYRDQQRPIEMPPPRQAWPTELRSRRLIIALPARQGILPRVKFSRDPDFASSDLFMASIDASQDATPAAHR
jgi:hypothetical protein